MNDFIKKVELHDDGFLEVTLKRLKDFDDYVFQQLQRDGNCLPCARDPKLKGKLYYDTKGYMTMLSYMQTHMFEKEELTDFLIFVFENMVRVNAIKPLWLTLTHIYLHYDGSQVRFLCIPISMEQWLFQSQALRNMLQEIIQEVKSDCAYETIGYLTQIQKQEDISLPKILQDLHDIKDRYHNKPTLLERLFHLERVETYQIRDLPQPVTYPTFHDTPHVSEEESSYQTIKEDAKQIQQKTMALLQEVADCGFAHVGSGKRYPISKETFTIGRSPDNDLCISTASISSYHACFHRNKRELEDLHSSNGTFVNDQKLHRVLLKDGDRICFAKECYIFYLVQEI